MMSRKMRQSPRLLLFISSVLATLWRPWVVYSYLRSRDILQVRLMSAKEMTHPGLAAGRARVKKSSYTYM